MRTLMAVAGVGTLMFLHSESSFADNIVTCELNCQQLCDILVQDQDTIDGFFDYISCFIDCVTPCYFDPPLPGVGDGI